MDAKTAVEKIIAKKCKYYGCSSFSWVVKGASRSFSMTENLVGQKMQALVQKIVKKVID